MIVFYHSIWQHSDHTHDHHKVGSLFWKRTLQKSKALATLEHFFKYPFFSQTKKAKYLPMLALSFCFQLSTLLRFRMKARHFFTYFFVILRFHLSTLRNNKFSKRFTLNTVVKSLISSAFSGVQFGRQKKTHQSMRFPVQGLYQENVGSRS